jgi:hypothetical protein
MYWKEIPAQVRATDANGSISVPLDDRFQVGIDAIAMVDGSAGTDDYLDAWHWNDYAEVDGAAEEVARSVAADINARFPKSFAKRVAALTKSGERNPEAGAANHWMDEQN